MYTQVHKNNQQTTGRALGKGSGSLPQSSTLKLVNWSRDVTVQTVTSYNDGELSRADCHKSQLGVWSIWHEFTIYMDDTMARLGK